MRLKLITPGAVRRLRHLLLAVAVGLAVSYFVMIRMPGRSFTGPLPPATESQRTLADQLRRDLEILARDIGERNVFNPKNLDAARAFIEMSLAEVGYDVQRHAVTVRPHGGSDPADDVECFNLSVEIAGSTLPGEIILLGAHYDSIYGSPGANDNGSGVIATLALARRFAGSAPKRSLRFVFFVNEEPPFFQVEGRMGSLIYARQCRERGENITAMLTLETIGWYSDEPSTQHYPIGMGAFYPSTGNFAAFVGNVKSRRLVRKIIESFREQVEFPSEGAALPGWIPGVGWSDHWSFWQAGYAGLMITDTAPFRYPYYHSPEDTTDRVDCERVARLTEGMQRVIARLVDE